ncbi:MAG: hypothetical protein WCV67_12515 [Victivallaceae bacterium]|jgi:hypothetical protein
MPTELELWEKKLKEILDEIDAELEKKFGGLFHRKTVRPAAGNTANPQYDGLFEVQATYTAGFGSRYGEGYAVEVRWVTFDDVPETTKLEAETIAEEILNRRLPEQFPGKNLKVVHDVSGMKITGDLSLK